MLRKRLDEPRDGLFMRRMPELGLIRSAFRLFDCGIHGLVRRCMEFSERIGGFRHRDPPARWRVEKVQQESVIIDSFVKHRWWRLDCLAAASCPVLSSRE